MHRKHRARRDGAAGSGQKQLDRARPRRAAIGHMGRQPRSANRPAELEVRQIIAGARRIDKFNHCQPRMRCQHGSESPGRGSVSRSHQCGARFIQHAERPELRNACAATRHPRRLRHETGGLGRNGFGDRNAAGLPDQCAFVNSIGARGSGFVHPHPALAGRIPFLDPAGGHDHPRARLRATLRKRCSTGEQKRKRSDQNSKGAVHDDGIAPTRLRNYQDLCLQNLNQSVPNNSRCADTRTLGNSCGAIHDPAC